MTIISKVLAVSIVVSVFLVAGCQKPIVDTVADNTSPEMPNREDAAARAANPN
jgi:hypothetical protein